MRRAWILAASIGMAVAGLATAAEPPEIINYQGILRDSLGNPVNGVRDMVFRFYDDGPFAGDDVLLWTETHLAAESGSVTITDGLFNVMLGTGDQTAGSEATFLEMFRDNATVYMEVDIDDGGGAETLSPRIRIVASGWALNAAHLDGTAASGFLDTSVASQTKAGDLILGGSLSVTSGVDLGPGASDDLTAADVTTLTGGGGADALHTHALAVGHSLDAADGSPTDVVLVDNDGGVKLSGVLNVEGDVAWVGDGTDSALRIVGDNSAAVWLQAGATKAGSTTKDIRFSGMFGAPIHMTITGAGDVGIGTPFPAVKLDVIGSISKTGGSFKIDHPLDPANKYLYHSFIESPDMMNIYNGNVVTDESGRVVISLPDWFDSLNKDFRYQLTVIGQPAQAVVAEEIQGNQFAIQTDKPNVKVSWQVSGIRRDPWAERNRVQVEEDKPRVDRGKYLYPDLYGLPKEFGVAFVPNHEATGVLPQPEQARPTKAGPYTAGAGDATAARSMDSEKEVYSRSFRPSMANYTRLTPVAGPVEEGDVLVIDPQRPGVMRVADMSADSGVFGIVAAEPIEDEESDRDADSPAAALHAPVIFSGVTRCKVDAGYGSIRPGDLLTTSPTPGHAMRADAPRPGTTVAKALEPLDVGTGSIQVLVMLR